MNHFYQDVAGWFDFKEVYEKAVKEAPRGAKFVEIGCWLGKSTSFLGVEMINAEKDLTLTCVDNWLGVVDASKDQKLSADDPYRLFLENTKPIRSILDIRKGYSVDMARDFPDETFWFVFIDASHDYENVKADIQAWLPKVVPGGIIGGDDYDDQYFGVKKAVTETFPNGVLVKQYKETPYSMAWWSTTKEMP